VAARQRQHRARTAADRFQEPGAIHRLLTRLLTNPAARQFPGPERDFIGYGPEPRHARCRGGALVAVHLLVNYEEGGEYSLSRQASMTEARRVQLRAQSCEAAAGR